MESNAASIVTIMLFGRVSHPKHTGTYAVDSDDRPYTLPGMAGVCSNLRLGSPVFGWACDHGEPGASIESGDAEEHLAIQVMSCLGNEVRVISGRAAGAIGTVIGKHAYILVDFTEDVLESMAPYDAVAIYARGQGLELVGCRDVVLRSCSPELLNVLPMGRLADGRISIAVAAVIPTELLGAGIGLNSEWAGQDVMLPSHAIASRYGVANLAIGDIVAMSGADHRYGRGYDPEGVAIGVVCHAVGPMPGHGIGVATIITAPSRRLVIRVSEGANIGRLLKPRGTQTGGAA